MDIFGFLRKKRNGGAVPVGVPEVGGMEFTVPEPAEKTFLKRAEVYARLWGTEKRIRMLRDEYDDYTARLAQLRNGAGETDSAVIEKLEAKRAAMGEESRAAAQKQVMDEPWEAVLEQLRFGEAKFRKKDSGVLAVSVPVTLGDAALQAGTVIDGTVTGEIRAGDVPVGRILFPLPLGGITAGQWVLEGMCIRSLPGDRTYSLKITGPQKLWVMEK